MYILYNHIYIHMRRSLLSLSLYVYVCMYVHGLCIENHHSEIIAWDAGGPPHGACLGRSKRRAKSRRWRWGW